MEAKELKRYNEAQIKEIMIYKWIRSEEEKCDIGFQSAALEWIGKYAADFRRYWFRIKTFEQQNKQRDY